MKRRQFLGIACASTVFVNACKKDEPTPTTTVQGTITDAAGKPVVGLEVEYAGDGGGGIPTFPEGSSPYVSFSEKTLTDTNGFFKITKVVPGGISLDGTRVMLGLSFLVKLESRKYGILISENAMIASHFDIELGKVNEYLITLK